MCYDAECAHYRLTLPSKDKTQELQGFKADHRAQSHVFTSKSNTVADLSYHTECNLIPVSSSYRRV